MKEFNFIWILLLLVIIGCTKNKEVNVLEDEPTSVDSEVEIPDTIVHFSELNYDSQTSIWTYASKAFSGYASRFNQDSILIEKIGFFSGKKESQAYIWYPDGHLKQIANYRNGKLHGEKKVWSPDGKHLLVSELNYKFGKPHGEQLKWYPTGELYKKMNLNMGQEEGLQQAFRKNGDLYANYEAKNGRIFGLKKAALCFGLEDEKMKNEK